MTSARRVGNAVDDELEFHESRHDLLRTMLAPDLHRNLPRHFLSDVKQPNSVPLRVPSRNTLPSSPYRTPQWAELRDCMRDVWSPPNPDADQFPVTAPQTASLPYAPCTSGFVAEHEVVQRLADLSQASDVDPETVAAALREAESVLEISVDPVTPQMYSRRLSSATSERSSDKGHAFPHRRRATSSLTAPAARHLDDRVAHQWLRCDGARHQERHHRFRSCDEGCMLSSDRIITTPELETTTGCHSSSPWGDPAPTPVISGSQALPYSVPSGVDIPAGSPSSFVASTKIADAVDPTMPWYDVYYGWMLYYQQLYAAQVLQGRRRQRARRGKREGSHRNHSGSAAPGETSAGKGVSIQQEEYTEHANVRGHVRSATPPGRVGEFDEGNGGIVETSGSMYTHPIRHSRSTSVQQPDLESRASGTRRLVGEERTRDVEEAARIRAEMRRLEEKYEAMSSWLASKEEEETRALNPSVRGTRRAALVSGTGGAFHRSKSAMSVASGPPRSQRGKWFGRRGDIDSTSRRNSLLPADTWEALSQRQHKGKLSRVVRVRTASESLPQRLSSSKSKWRH